jgi:hypothetical protein
LSVPRPRSEPTRQYPAWSPSYADGNPNDLDDEDGEDVDFDDADDADGVDGLNLAIIVATAHARTLSATNSTNPRQAMAKAFRRALGAGCWLAG